MRIPFGFSTPSRLLAASVLAASAIPSAGAPSLAVSAFTPHYFSDSSLFNKGFRETLSPADVDADGDQDFFTGNGRGGSEYWFENRGGAQFLPHLVSDSNDADVGAAAIDVDGDGDLDRLAGGFLYLNPGNPKELPFRTESTGAPAFTHDLLAGDMDKDGRQDFVVIDPDGIQWFRNPGPPFGAGAAWPAGVVSAPDSISEHGGLALGDFDGDGDLDVFRVNRWFENRDGGSTWIRHPGPDFGDDNGAGYGLTSRTVVEDIDKDGDLDLAQAECDLANGRVAWFENRDKGATWIQRLVKDSTDRQDFHSLDLADFDGDGDLDFMSAGGPNTPGARHWYIWENLDGKGGSFLEHVIWKDAAYGGHEAIAMDMDGDGDQDILGKEFAAYHVWLENPRISGTAVRGPGFGAAPGPAGRPLSGQGLPAGWWPWTRGDGDFNALGRRLPASPAR